MNWLVLRMVLPAIILIFSLLLLQHHSMQYWTHLTTGQAPTWDAAFWLAPWRGWGWSVLLEAIALLGWSRWRRWPFFVLGFACSVLLLAGPLENLLRKQRQTQQSTLSAPLPKTTLDTRIAGAGQALTSARASLKRQEEEGLFLQEDALPKARARIARKEARLDALLADKQAQEAKVATTRQAKALALTWPQLRWIGFYASALTLAQVGASLSTALPFAPNPANTRKRLHQTLQTPANTCKRLHPTLQTPANAGSHFSQSPDWQARIKAVQTAIARHEQLAGGLSALARQLGVPAANLSMGVNHCANLAAGKRTLGPDAWEALERVLTAKTTLIDQKP